MQRILFLCLLGFGIVVCLLAYNETTWIRNTKRETIIVSLIYDGVVEEIELEPFTDVQTVLDSRTFENMDAQKINPKRILSHRDVLNIPLIQEVACVSINMGTKEELMSLKGVGEKLSLEIIQNRKKEGNFQELEDLLRVKGMGSRKFEMIKDMICL